jgi:uncharacterized protein (TIGR00369 family)
MFELNEGILAAQQAAVAEGARRVHIAPGAGADSDAAALAVQAASVGRHAEERITPALRYGEALLRGRADPPPIAKLLGLTLRDIATGRAVMELDAQARHQNPMGTLHGGVLCDLSDAAMGIAFSTLLAEGETFTTVELKINFLRPVRAGRVVATATVRDSGRSMALVECDMHDDRGRLVAHASSTCMRLVGEKARGRDMQLAVEAA